MDDLIKNNLKNLINTDGDDFCADFSYISGKTILVTGAGGSIGGELCRKLALLCPKRIVLADICENGIFELCSELSQNGFNAFSPEILSVTDLCALEKLFEKHCPDIVFHAAAHKHVPLMELCPSEAVKNNVFGTKNVADLAVKHGAEKFFLISTDKAVNPVSIMGATKRICEYIVWENSRRQSKTAMITVRFGNVFGSNGSVIPLFEKQIAANCAVTVTHPECTRFFMSIPRAVSFVISAGAIAKGGETFVADMGEPINVTELAKQLILSHGLVPETDVKITYTGLRPGEKLHEELFEADESFADSCISGIFVCKSCFSCSQRLCGLAQKISLCLAGLDNACKTCNDFETATIMKDIFPSLLG